VQRKAVVQFADVRTLVDHALAAVAALRRCRTRTPDPNIAADACLARGVASAELAGVRSGSRQGARRRRQILATHVQQR